MIEIGDTQRPIHPPAEKPDRSRRSWRSILVSGFLLAIAFSIPLRGEAAADVVNRVPRGTIFYASFDDGAKPDHAPYVTLVRGSAEPIADGRRGGGLRASERAHLVYSGGAVGLDPSQGMIECWIRMRWPENENRPRPVFHLDMGPDRLVKLKRGPRGRFGFAIAQPDETGTRSVSHVRSAKPRLRPGKWHHVAFSWAAGRTELRIDEELVASASDVQLPFDGQGDLKITGSDFDLDDLRISAASPATLRSASTDLSQTEPFVAPVRDRRWPFVEPESANRLEELEGMAPSDLDWRAKSLLSDFDPHDGWPERRRSELSLSLAPGMQASAAFLVAARNTTTPITIRFEPSSTAGMEGIAPDAEFTRVVRTFERSFWKAPRKNVVEVARFLTPWTPRPFEAGEFSEIWLTMRAPIDLPPGTHRGIVHVSTNKDSLLRIPVELKVRRYSLDAESTKELGIYYYFEEKLHDESEVLLELADLRRHGVRHLITDLEIQHSPANANFQPNVEMARRGLELIRRSGFDGTIVIQNGLPRVAKWRAPYTNAIDEDRTFRAVVPRTMKSIANLVSEFPELDIYQTFLDEVFTSEERFDRYVRIAKLIRASSNVPLYITINTRYEKNDDLRRQLDPFVDFRGHQGFSFEWWMTRGNRLEEMARELAASNDRALFYHNARAPYFTALRSRLVNGLLLWAWPFESHAPWIYQQYAGNPFDDRDADRHDFGMAFPQGQGELVSTRLWEGTREGWIDLRHLQTLERLLSAHGSAKPDVARRARRILDSTRSLIVEAALEPKRPAPNARTNERGGLRLNLPERTNSPDEAPLLSALEAHFGAWGLDVLREELAILIEALTPSS